jgi:hypothetical protein
MITLILFLTGVGLCIVKHPLWGSLCLVFAFVGLVVGLA